VTHTVEEARILIPGVTAFLGFQLVVMALATFVIAAVLSLRPASRETTRADPSRVITPERERLPGAGHARLRQG
jgi:hypothetical protein